MILQSYKYIIGDPKYTITLYFIINDVLYYVANHFNCFQYVAIGKFIMGNFVTWDNKYIKGNL